MELRQYAAIVWRWAWLIVLCVVLAGGSAYVTSERQPPRYQATATLLINQASSNVQDYSALMTGQVLAKTYAKLITKRPVLEEVVSALNLDLSPDDVARRITVSLERDTQLITLRVVDQDPVRARRIANAVPTVFAEQSEEMQLSRYTSSKESLLKEMAAVTAEISLTQVSLDALRAATNPDQSAITTLADALLQMRSSYSNLQRSFEEIRVAEAKTMPTVTVAESAAFASVVGPKTMTNTLLAAVVSALIAVGVGFLIEYLDDTVKSPDDVERTAHLPTLGAITNFRQASLDGPGPIAAAEPKSAIAEGYRVLRTNVQFAAMGLGHSGALMLITSAQPKEGKTTSLANMGVSLAQAGKRVLLVDTDLRRPALHKHFGLANDAGLTALLLEREADWEKVIQPTAVAGLRVLTAGRSPANPAEVLSFPELGELLERLRPAADYVLLDSPPVLGVADASILAQKVDAVLLVVEMGRTRTEAFQRAVEGLQSVKARLMGAVLNKVSARPGSYYYEHYYHYYHSYYDDEDGQHKERKRTQRSLLTRLFRRSARKRTAPPVGPAEAQEYATLPAPLQDSLETSELAQGPAPAPARYEAADLATPALPAWVVSTPPQTTTSAPAGSHRAKRRGATRHSRLRPWHWGLMAVIALAALAAFSAYMGWIRLPPLRRNPQGYVNQGRAYLMVENYAEAARLFARALELDPGNPGASLGLQEAQKYLLITDVYREASQLVQRDRCAEAIEKLEAIVAVDPWYKDAGVMLKHCQGAQ